MMIGRRLPEENAPFRAGSEPPDCTLAGEPPARGLADDGRNGEAESIERTVADELHGSDARAVTCADRDTEEWTGRKAPVIPDYEIYGELGRGGMGVVYRARQRRLNRPCALKMILAGAHADRVAGLRFRAEAEAVARLQHPNVVQIHNVGEADGLPFFELELVDGGSLDQQLDGTPWPAAKAANLIEQLGRGVAEAHRIGVVHRDLKPANILMTAGGQPKITDFGLAKSLGVASSLTATESILGSPSYMAPEQAEGGAKRTGPASDTYALGAIFYELLTGRPPFRGASVLETLEQVRTAEPVAPHRLVPGVPRDLDTIVIKCLQKDPLRRYGAAAEMADDVRRFVDGKPILARPAPPWERVIKLARRRPLAAGLFVAVHILFAALLALGMWSYFEIRRALGVAERQKAIALEAGRRQAEEARNADKARVAAQSETYRATVSEVRALRLGRPTGWRADALGSLARIARLDAPGRDLTALRTEAVACLAGLDAREVARFASDDVARHSEMAAGVWELDFSPDGRTLATSVGMEAPLHLWDVGGRQFERALPVEADRRVAVFLPDGSSIACSVGSDVIFAPADGRGRARLGPTGTGTVGAVAFDRTGRRMAVIWTKRYVDTEAVRVVDLATMETLRTFAGPLDQWSYKVPLALHPDGRIAAMVGPDHAVQLLSVDDVAPPVTLGHHSGLVTTLRFSPDGALLASASNSGDLSVKLWDVARHRELLRLSGHTARVWGIAFSPRGDLLASSSDDQTLRIWDTRTGEALLVVPLTGGPGLSVAFSPDETHVAVGGTEWVSVFALSGRHERIRLVGHEGRIVAQAFNPAGERLVTASADHFAIVWDRGDGRPVARWRRGRPDEHIASLAIRPDGATVASGTIPFAGRDLGTYPVELWNAASGEPLGLLQGPRGPVMCLAFDQEGRRLAAGSMDGTAFLWDVATRSLIGRRSLDGGIGTVAVIDGAARWLAATQAGRIALFEPDGRIVRDRQLGGAGPVVVAAAPTAALLAAGDAAGTVWLLGLPGLDPVRTLLHAHPDRVLALALAADGRLLATAGDDRRVVLRDARTLQALYSLPALDTPVSSLNFSPDGRSLAILCVEEIATVWDLARVRDGLVAQGLDWGEPTEIAAEPPSTDRSPTVVRGPAPGPDPQALLAALTMRDDGARLYREGQTEAGLRKVAVALDTIARMGISFPENRQLLRLQTTTLRFLGLLQRSVGRADLARSSFERLAALLGSRRGLAGPDLVALAAAHAQLAELATGPPSAERAAAADAAVSALRRAAGSGDRISPAALRDASLFGVLQSRADFQAILDDAVFPAEPFAAPPASGNPSSGK
jgi:WD40 repeat protein